MDFTGQIVQLVVVVAVLVLAYFGVMVWTKRAGSRQGARGAGEGEAAASRHLAEALGHESPRVPKTSSERLKGRFKLQGKDAEVAAKVLKRMLKGDDSEESSR